MRPTNHNANRELRNAIGHLAEALPARMKTRAECIEFAIIEIHRALEIQPELRDIVLRGLADRNLTITNIWE
jgi:hypothetical protein